MKLHTTLVLSMILSFAGALVPAPVRAAEDASELSEEESRQLARGRYLVRITGCNDCHTPNYNEREGNVPERQWLIGTSIGYKGPWGTTYAENVRHIVAGMTADQWVRYAKTMKAKPPMPWFNLNKTTTADLRAMYVFIRHLGDSNNRVPEELPPGRTPTTPYINMEVVNPGAFD